MKKFSGSGMQPDPDGVIWWDSVSKTERAFWLAAANSVFPSDAYTARLLSCEGWNIELSAKTIAAFEAIK